MIRQLRLGVFFFLIVLLTGNVVHASDLEMVKQFNDERPGNPTVTPEGRLIITMSALSNPDINIKEVLPNGNTIPFPTLDWASRPTSPNGIGIVKAIGIKSTKEGNVWVLDMGELPNHLPKLVSFDSKTKKVKQIIKIPKGVLQNHSFLQDFVIDEKRNKIYIADMDFNAEKGKSEKPAIIVVDVNTGKMKRVLESHPSLMPTYERMIVNGKVISSKNKDGKTVIHYYGLNPISIDPKFEWVYFGAMSGKKIFRIPSKVLSEGVNSPGIVSNNVHYYAPKPFCDGFVVDDKGNVYITDVQNSAIGVSNPKGYKILVKSKDLLPWPDGLTIYNGYLYIVANQLNTLPGLNNGMDESKPPYYINRIFIGEN